MRHWSSCTWFIVSIFFLGRACCAADPATIKDCDRLAANPTDPAALSPGVSFAQVQAHAAQALAACRDALQASPTDPRYKYQLGRSLEASGAPEKAHQLYLEAAQAGYVMAMARVTENYRVGIPGVKKDSDAALMWGRRAAATGSPIALAYLAYVLEDNEDTRKEAAFLYLKAAEGGYRNAFYGTGYYFERGIGLPRDLEKAAFWFHRSADEAGNASAMDHLAFMYQAGLGVPKDRATGLAWLTKAAQSDPESKILLAREYLSDRFDAKNSSMAIELLKSAADGGSTDAMKQLGMLYGEGVFVAKDDLYSIIWYKKAVEAGDKTSIDTLFSIYTDRSSYLFDPEISAEYFLKLILTEPRDTNWPKRLLTSLDGQTIKAIQYKLAAAGIFHEKVDGLVSEVMTAAVADYVKSGSQK